jgi:tetratricopeptide (TPR) repeat protein
MRQEGHSEGALSALTALAKSQPSAAIRVLAKVESGELMEQAGNLAGAHQAFQDALDEAGAAETVSRWHGEIDLRARIETRLGGILILSGETRAAFATYGRALLAWQRAGHPLAESRLLAQLGELALQNGRPVEAARFFEGAAAAADRCGDLLLKGQHLLNLVKVRRVMNDLPGASQAVREVIALADQIGWVQGHRAAEAALG